MAIQFRPSGRNRLPDILEEARRRRAKLRKCGSEYIGPCPRCGGHDRFAINTRKQVFICRQGNAGGDVIELVKYLDGVDYKTAVARLHLPDRIVAASTPPPEAVSVRHSLQREPSELVLRIWNEAKDFRHNATAQKYFVNRGADLDELPSATNGALRWHPTCPWMGGQRPCLVALWTDIISAEPRAIHRRPITSAGNAETHWCALGPTAGCIIRIWPDDSVTQGLILAEGIETALVAATQIQHRGTLLQPTWAAGDRGHVASFPLLPGVESLTLLVDNDTNGAGQRAANECARRWVASGREVIRLLPRAADTDFADVVGTGGAA